MPDIISARLNDEALERWKMWPKGSRSRRLSRLLVDQDEIHQRAAALDTRVGYLLTLLSECRRIIAKTPPSEAVGEVSLRTIINHIDGQTEGTLHHAYSGLPNPDRDGVDQ